MMSLQQLLPDVRLPEELAHCGVQGLQLDSRRVARGDTFIAVPGISGDGRRFVSQAIASGAPLVLCEADQAGLEWRDGVPCLQLPGLSERVGELAARWYGEPSRAMQVIGVTGTNGKTSISWFLRDAFNALGHRCALVGTLGLGLKGEEQETGHTTPDPLTLQAGLARVRDAGADAVAMEVSSHALDQGRLGETLVRAAVFSNLSRDHLDYHGDMERYLAAKSALFTRPGVQLAVINTDDNAASTLIGRLDDGVRCVTYGSQAGATVRCREYHCSEEGLQITLMVGGEPVALTLPLFGHFTVSNIMAVAGTLHGLNVRAEELGPALMALTPVPGRMEPVRQSGAATVIVDYAHTPDGLEKALQACREHFSGRLHCVVGCGGDRDSGKRPQMAAVAERLADVLVLTSDNPRSEAPQAIIDDMLAGVSDPQRVHCQVERRVAINEAIQRAAPGDVVLLAGKGHETYQEIAGVRHHSDDRELARQALQARGGAQ
ncbi:UDP-N-acetylmuramoylalanyl-D-glutamate--2, 6-diaminopimelate ligase [Alcanivorax hongdengensis A-11-3]|uniref:UDP-N-acetylmuramoyl-L-alanyl-D-glutamate--2,6-diaminopimelate ligase n=1 Tax=Alcanivorax hongdengensis A-11-3 TaxID=1177179 RepID=L0WB88_9GAMM|nr:UDP-N-acetylmuramoyl-L-alanyl-D-glutamate--2,6-diaminopimelate ligase [Alcanivorax hongdengensis]EKF74269.1 UDP-N-acetylmuramoylalanyl-D-glutamate--2, 6-diaminopimelate ligase [Alcanivorax hongdengensis A-11-3]